MNPMQAYWNKQKKEAQQKQKKKQKELKEKQPQQQKKQPRTSIGDSKEEEKFQHFDNKRIQDIYEEKERRRQGQYQNTADFMREKKEKIGFKDSFINNKKNADKFINVPGYAPGFITKAKANTNLQKMNERKELAKLKEIKSKIKKDKENNIETELNDEEKKILQKFYGQKNKEKQQKEEVILPTNNGVILPQTVQNMEQKHIAPWVKGSQQKNVRVFTAEELEEKKKEQQMKLQQHLQKQQQQQQQNESDPFNQVLKDEDYNPITQYQQQQQQFPQQPLRFQPPPPPPPSQPQVNPIISNNPQPMPSIPQPFINQENQENNKNEVIIQEENQNEIDEEKLKLKQQQLEDEQNVIYQQNQNQNQNQEEEDEENEQGDDMEQGDDENNEHLDRIKYLQQQFEQEQKINHPEEEEHQNQEQEYIDPIKKSQQIQEDLREQQKKIDQMKGPRSIMAMANIQQQKFEIEDQYKKEEIKQDPKAKKGVIEVQSTVRKSQIDLTKNASVFLPPQLQKKLKNNQGQPQKVTNTQQPTQSVPQNTESQKTYQPYSSVSVPKPQNTFGLIQPATVKINIYGPNTAINVPKPSFLQDDELKLYQRQIYKEQDKKRAHETMENQEIFNQFLNEIKNNGNDNKETENNTEKENQ